MNNTLSKLGKHADLAAAGGIVGAPINVVRGRTAQRLDEEPDRKAS